jgi:hypothetical protein
MKSLKFIAAVGATILATTLHAASIDMNDPRRSVGREDDVRVDAQLLTDTVSAGTPIGVTWQIQNFTDSQVAVATRVVDATYDEDSRTITLSIGSEVPQDGNMPAMVVIEPGEKKVFRAAATARVAPAATRSRNGAPRFVQVKVSILRNLAPFLSLLARQSPTARPESLSDELFEQWFESTDTIFLNTLPVQWNAQSTNSSVDVERRGTRF